MLQTYEARIKNNQIFWADDAPQEGECDVMITIFPKKNFLINTDQRPKPRKAMLLAAKKVTAFNDVDGVAYQRALRSEWP